METFSIKQKKEDKLDFEKMTTTTTTTPAPAPPKSEQVSVPIYKERKSVLDRVKEDGVM